MERRRTARIAGFAFLFTFLIVVVSNFGISERLSVAGDAAATARNILSQERLFRIGITCNLLYFAGLLVLSTALYVILEPAGRGLALLAAFSRLAYGSMWVLMALKCFEALRLLSGPPYLQVLGVPQLQALAKLQLGARFDEYYVGLPFFAFASMICGYLWLKSGYIPKALAAAGLVASAWCAVCAFAFLVFPAFDRIVNDWLWDTPMGLFEVVLGFWLLIKGLKID